VPKQNRPLVRGGRLQAKKKRTDRSYLRPADASAEPEATTAEEDTRDASDVVRAAVQASEPSMPTEPTEAFNAPTAVAAPVQQSVAGARLPTTVRALQQQGVRKRREFDIQALQRRDSEYAVHELRRIFVLAAMVVITLIVLTIVLR
jgi:hypothetical protein